MQHKSYLIIVIPRATLQRAAAGRAELLVNGPVVPRWDCQRIAAGKLRGSGVGRVVVRTHPGAASTMEPVTLPPLYWVAGFQLARYASCHGQIGSTKTASKRYTTL